MAIHVDVQLSEDCTVCTLYVKSPLPTAFSARQSGVGEVSEDYLSLLSHATETRLRDILEKVTQISQHRTEVLKVNLVFNAYTHVRRCLHINYTYCRYM